MENRKPRGRPRMYTSDEIRKKKTDYMLNKDWFCEICERRYSLACKHMHLRTIKHVNNLIKSFYLKEYEI